MGRTGKTLIQLWVVTLGLIGAGVALVLNMQPPPKFGCDGPPKGATMDHLARCDHGVKARASSTDGGGGHDPAYVIDGRIGNETEKWVSADGDSQPTLTLEWERPRRISKVTLHHAGVKEMPGYTTKEFKIEARVDGVWSKLAHVTDNAAHVSTHGFATVSTDALRVVVLSPSSNGNNRARLYEVEVR